MARAIEYQGVSYPSIAAAARVHNLTWYEMSYALQVGERRTYTWDGKTFKTQTDLAKYAGCSLSNVNDAVRIGRKLLGKPIT